MYVASTACMLRAQEGLPGGGESDSVQSQVQRLLRGCLHACNLRCMLRAGGPARRRGERLFAEPGAAADHAGGEPREPVPVLHRLVPLLVTRCPASMLLGVWLAAAQQARKAAGVRGGPDGAALL